MLRRIDHLKTLGTSVVAFSGGMGAGKSFSGAMKAIDLAMANHGEVGILWGPTIRDVREGIRKTIKELLQGTHASGFHIPIFFEENKRIHGL